MLSRDMLIYGIVHMQNTGTCKWNYLRRLLQQNSYKNLYSIPFRTKSEKHTSMLI